MTTIHVLETNGYGWVTTDRSQFDDCGIIDLLLYNRRGYYIYLGGPDEDELGTRDGEWTVHVNEATDVQDGEFVDYVPVAEEHYTIHSLPDAFARVLEIVQRMERENWVSEAGHTEAHYRG